MEDEARVLQQRIQAVAIDGRLDQPLERVRGQQCEQQETDCDHTLHRQHPGAKRGWHVAAAYCHKHAEYDQNQNPEQQRPFMVAPRRCQLIEERLGGMRIALT